MSEPCTAATKQKALYLRYDFDPPLVYSPATDISVEHTWNSTADLRRWGANGVFAAQPIGTLGGVGGYFGSQVFGDPSSHGGKLLFSIWDFAEKRVQPANISACLARGGPNITWCTRKHAFALSENCHRHCLDCGLHPGWHNTTGVQCSADVPSLTDGQTLRFRLRQTASNATFSEPQQGLGLTYHGAIWELTATVFHSESRISRNGSHGDDENSSSSLLVGRMFWERTPGGLSRFGAFHEHIGCTPCHAFFESETRTGPWVGAPPLGRAVRAINFTRPNVTCQEFDVHIEPAGTSGGAPSAQFSTGPGPGEWRGASARGGGRPWTRREHIDV
jgi:hypothetical protein